MSDDSIQVRVRPAVIGDLERLRQFEQGVISAERHFDPTLNLGVVRYYDIERMLDENHVHFVIAEMGSVAVGCGFARIDAAKPYLAHTEQGYLGLMYVDPEYRGRSVNAAIIEALVAWCRSRSIMELRLEVYGGNLRALRAYEKAGFEEHVVEMRMRLDQDCGAKKL